MPAAHRHSHRALRVIVSVASYLSAGAPADDGHGIYGCLANRVTSVRSRLSAGTGTDVTLEFVHDGTAAAASAGSVNSATITAGTALGSGFRPAQAPPSLDLAPDLWTGAVDRRALIGWLSENSAERTARAALPPHGPPVPE